MKGWNGEPNDIILFMHYLNVNLENHLGVVKTGS